MKLSLLILKGRRQKDDNKISFRFVILDSDKGRSYPHNFVCVLPKTFRPSTARSLKMIFGIDGRELAERLLSEAKLKERDSETLQEIDRRLKAARLSGKSNGTTE